MAQTLWQVVRVQLDQQKTQVIEAIRSYPPPIPACDAQFNHLLEERARISREIGRLETLAREHPDDLNALADFVRASACLDERVFALLAAE
jgi:chorismate mutase